MTDERSRTPADVSVAEMERLLSRALSRGGSFADLYFEHQRTSSLLVEEGIIRTATDVVTAQLCAGTDTPNTYNVVDVVLGADVPAPVTDPSRNFYTTSSCGVCGKASIDAVRTRFEKQPFWPASGAVGERR